MCTGKGRYIWRERGIVNVEGDRKGRRKTESEPPAYPYKKYVQEKEDNESERYKGVDELGGPLLGD